MKSILMMYLFFSASFLFSQNYQTSIQGRVLELSSNYELVGANIELIQDSVTIQTTISDVHGEFVFQNVNVGKYELVVSMLGYTTQEILNLNLHVAKTKQLEIHLQVKDVKLGSVDIKVNPKDQTKNTSISVSGRAFNLEEAQRYSGSRSDIARMASNYAGVQGNNDTRNDIIVRGNTPTGLLWRVEGVDVFNPNHFAIAGTNGGPVALVNHKVIAKSDFITGAFPAEYGNAISGVFDLNFRSGNNKEHDFNAQLGILGTELLAEGPIANTRASYLVAYRYSTLSLFKALGVNIGTQAVPKYQDLSYKLNFPLKGQANISIFGMGGISNNNTIVSDYEKPEIDLFSWSDRNVYFDTGMGVTGLTFEKTFSKKLSIRSTLAGSLQEIKGDHNLVYRPSYQEGQTWGIDSIVPKLRYQFLSDKVSSVSKFVIRPNIKNIVSIGYSAELLHYNFFDSLYNETTYEFESRINFNEPTYLIQPYAEWRHFFNEKLKMTAGVRYLYFDLSESQSIEPRLGLTYLLGDKSNLALGYGRHSVTQPIYFYFQSFENSSGVYGQHNRQMDLTLSDHLIFSYKRRLKSNSRFKAEIYYQWLSNVPVAKDSSGYSLLNTGTSSVQIQAEDVVNNGTARNYGMEFTFEKFFVKDFFTLSTLSLFESKYTDLRGIEYNSSFNGNYSYNLLAGKSFHIGRYDNKTLEFGLKLTLSGGRYYTPIDLEESILQNTAVLNNDLTNSEKFNDYSRLDIRFSYKVSLAKVSHIITLDLINVTNQQNQFQEIFVAPTDQSAAYTTFQNQLNFLPFLDYQFHF